MNWPKRVASLSADARHHFSALQQRFDDQAYKAEQLTETMPATLRSLAWALRWEQARLLQQLEQILELSDAIQEERQASCVLSGTGESAASGFHPGGDERHPGLSLRFAGRRADLGRDRLGRSASRDGAGRDSLLADGNVPQTAAAGGAKLCKGAILWRCWCRRFINPRSVPTISDFELMALLLAPLLYAVAVEGSPHLRPPGTGIDLGLSTFQLLGPSKIVRVSARTARSQAVRVRRRAISAQRSWH